MRTRRSAVGVLCGVALMLGIPGHAASLVWKTSRAQAVETARNSSRLILLVAGRDTCGNCQYMKSTVCESSSARMVLDANYVCWLCPVDNSTEWHAYASGLGSFTLPLICVLDPGNATSYLDRTTATQTESVFRARLRSHLPAQPIALTLDRGTVSRLGWGTESAVRYRVLRSENLGAWGFVGGIVDGTGSVVDFEDPTVAGRYFYKVMGFR